MFKKKKMITVRKSILYEKQTGLVRNATLTVYRILTGLDKLLFSLDGGLSQRLRRVNSLSYIIIKQLYYYYYYIYSNIKKIK